MRISLGVLRAYLVAMTLMLSYHVLDLAGVLHKDSLTTCFFEESRWTTQ